MTSNQHTIRQNLAYQNLTEIPQEIADIAGFTVTELDLTNNRISDLRCLMPYKRLKTLVLDHNHIKSHVKIPEMISLHTLWVNHNKIENLATFMNELSKQCPNLQILSMMNNEAAPSYFNNGSFQQYMDYRHYFLETIRWKLKKLFRLKAAAWDIEYTWYYVISRLPKLEFLDDKKIEDSERAEAERIYKPVRKKKSKRSSEA